MSKGIRMLVMILLLVVGTAPVALARKRLGGFHGGFHGEVWPQRVPRWPTGACGSIIHIYLVDRRGTPPLWIARTLHRRDARIGVTRHPPDVVLLLGPPGFIQRCLYVLSRGLRFIRTRNSAQPLRGPSRWGSFLPRFLLVPSLALCHARVVGEN
jgi:hypothetical protein